MKRFFATATIALSITTAAQATNTTTMFARDYWRVTHMARNYVGKPMCIMSSQLSFATSITAFVQIKWVKGQTNPFIELDKTNWHFPSDIQVPFTINLDSGRHEFAGVSKVDSTRGFSIIVTYTIEDGSTFLDDFASSTTMAINFHNGNEPRWSIKMAGSRDATKAFRSCVKGLAEESTPDEAQAPISPVPQTPTSPVPDASSPRPVPTVPIKKPKGEQI